MDCRKISGGCLCQSIRYEIIFDNNAPWPPPSATCRKWTATETSSLLTQFIVIKPTQIVPALSSFQTYTEYSSSPRRHRGFCSRCGSSLIWRSEDITDTLDLYLGTIDEKWLVGERVEGSERNTSYGIQFERIGGVGEELCTPS
ncbi:hypothetical protein PENSTE_c007G03260 [Penicillium steckii]|uniref:CENP-V/GFA domain-containing protein n=1 Tax=Penicillium steckii TaxID=303698 RepID=A0A1V6TE74_9EURO|nr:hypothetical protein PENSTE_c007G03260 [Penicillium steckii]